MKEIKKLFEMGTFFIVDEDNIPPGHERINCCMSFKIDGNGNVLDCNADVRQQEVGPGSYGDTSAPTSKSSLHTINMCHSSSGRTDAVSI